MASTLGVGGWSISPTRVSDAITVTFTLPGSGIIAPNIAIAPIVLSLPAIPARVSTFPSPFCMETIIVSGPTMDSASLADVSVSKDLTVRNTISIYS